MFASQVLAQMYYDGQGVRQDFSQAFEWYSKSAEKRVGLRTIYAWSNVRARTPTPKDMVKAVECITGRRNQ